MISGVYGSIYAVPKKGKSRRGPKRQGKGLGRRFSWRAYREYLKSPAWAEVRKKKLESVGARCEWCGYDKWLEVHHKHYRHTYVEGDKLGSLLVLCHRCHARLHRKSERGLGRGDERMAGS